MSKTGIHVCFTLLIYLSCIESSLYAQEEVVIEEHSVGEQINSTIDLLAAGIASTRVSDQFRQQPTRKNVIEKEIPLKLYSQKQLDHQREVNGRSESIVTIEIDEEKEFLTDFDKESITPITWKWVDLQVTRGDGSTSSISLRRPIWWIDSVGIHEEGDVVWLNLPEIGVSGSASVKHIRANTLDTRIWEEQFSTDKGTTRPITGKFVHEADQVYLLHFDSLPEPVGVTAGHRIWSADQAGWVAVENLQLGELVRTPDGTQRLIKIELKQGNFKVYNIEVYRNHNYLVSSSKLLVHNVCWYGEKWKRMRAKAEKNPKMYGNMKVTAISEREGDLLRVYVDVFDSNGAKTDFGMVSFLKQVEKEARQQGVKKLEIGTYPVINPELKKGFKELSEGDGIKGFKVSYTTDQYGDGAVLITKDLD